MEKTHVCPWWMGYFLLSPLRRTMQSPAKILENYIRPGMKVIDYGSAMGYFSLPMARMTGPGGKVYCFDIQERMLHTLRKRADKKRMKERIETRLIGNGNLVFDDLRNDADFALLFAVAHEVPDRESLFKTLAGMMKQHAVLLFAEPAGHVTLETFEHSVSLAEKAGFRRVKALNINRSHAVLLERD